MKTCPSSTVTRNGLAALAIIAILIWGSATEALPVFSRQFGVICVQCHTVPPRLNKFGYAFQANFFNWPGTTGHPRKDPTAYMPVSAITTYGYRRDITGSQDTSQIRAFELYLSSGFGPSRGGRGGYFVDLHLDDAPGDLEDAYVSLPILGRNGQLALTIGQVTPMLYQADPVNSLTNGLPYALTEGSGGFTWDEATPSIRLAYFDNRGKMSPDGNYATVAVPFGGHLQLTRSGTVTSGNGVFVHAFHRWGYATAGALAFLHKSASQVGVVATYPAARRLNVSAFATLAHEPGLNTTHAALEGEYLVTNSLAITGRAELIGGDRSELSSVAALTYYPLRYRVLRLTGELRERRGDRAFNLFVRIQL